MDLFWLSFISALVCACSLTAVLVLDSLLSLIYWMKEFLLILSGAVLMLLIQAFSRYIPGGGSSLPYVTLVLLSGLLIHWDYLSLIGIWNPDFPLWGRRLFQWLWAAIILTVIFLRWIDKGDILLQLFLVIQVLPVFVPSFLVLLHFRRIKKREFGSFLLLFCFLSIGGYIFEAAEFYIRRVSHEDWGQLPPGVLSFPLFSLLLALAALFFSHKILKALKNQLRGNGPTESQITNFCIRHELSPRESEILRWMLLRFTHREIAEKLSISPRTVERHAYNMYQKTGLSSRFELYDLVRIQ